MKLKILLIALFLLYGVSSCSIACRYLGIHYPVEDACWDCCAKKVSKLHQMSSEERWKMRRPCTDECVELAESQDRDGFWVEENQACGFGFD